MTVTRAMTLMALAAILVGCGVVQLPIGGGQPPVPSDAVRLENVVLADDRRSVRVDFIGGEEFDPDNPCSIAYTGTAEIVGEELEIGIYAQKHPKELPPDTYCDLIGYPRTLTLELDEPFIGSVIRDLAGQVFMLEPPAGLAQIGLLPDSWELRLERNVIGSPTPRWERAWSPAEGDSMLALIQAFGGPVNTTGGDQQSLVQVNGQEAVFFLHPPSGEMVVVWSLGADELALVGNLADFTQAELIALAESVRLP